MNNNFLDAVAHYFPRHFAVEERKYIEQVFLKTTSMSERLNFLESYIGLNSTKVSKNLKVDDWKDVVCELNNGNFVVVASADPLFVKIFDPLATESPIYIGRSEFLESLKEERYFLAFDSAFDGFSRNEDVDQFRMAGDKKYALFLLLISSGLFGLFSTFFLMVVLDKVIPGSALVTLNSLFAIIIISIFVESVFNWLGLRIISTETAKIHQKIATNLLRKSILERNSSCKNENIGEISTLLSKLELVKKSYGGQSIALIVELIFGFVAALIIGFISIKILLVNFVVSILHFFIAKMHNKNLKHAHERKLQALTMQRDFFSTAALNADVINGSGVGKVVQNKWIWIQNGLAEVENAYSNINNKFKIVAEFLDKIGYALVIWLSANFVISEEMTVGMLVAVVLLSRRLMAPSAKMAKVLEDASVLKIAKSTLDQFLLRKNTYKRSGWNSDDKARASLVCRDIEIRYNENKKFCGKFELDARSVQDFFIFGKSLSGKTSILKVIAGLQAPSHGSVEINGCNIDLMTDDDLRRLVVYVDSLPVLLDGTLGSNIYLSQESGSIRIAEDFLRETGVESYIRDNYKDQMNAYVRTNNVRYPPWFLQGISVARALSLKCKILLLDDALSAYSIEDQKRIYHKIVRSRRGLVTIVASKNTELRDIFEETVELQGGAV